MRKTLILLSVLALSACSNIQDDLREQQQFAADIDAIGQEGQNKYFACRFVRHMWECREAVWQKYPKPHAPGGNQREFLQRYIDSAERRGATNILKAKGLPCGEVTSLNSFFWREGQEATCSNGHQYQIERDGEHWRVTLIKESA